MKQAKAAFERVVSRRLMIISAVLAVAVSAWCVSGIRERRAQAAAATPQATPTPAPTPDYTNVDDILEGRRELLKIDDVVVTIPVTFADDDSNVITEFDQTTLQTANSAFTQAVIPPIGDPFNLFGQSLGPLVGRMFNLPHDIVMTALSKEPDGNVWVVVADTVNNKTYSTALTDPYGLQTLFSFMMADFNGDGYTDAVLNYGFNDGSYYRKTAIVTAQDVNNIEAGLKVTSTENTTPISNMAVGDFNGDGRPDIIGVEAGENGRGLQLAYHTVDPKTFAISDGVFLPIQNPITDSGRMINISAAAGRFTNADHDQLAVAYYTDSSYDPGDFAFGVKLVVIDFDLSTPAPPQAQLGPVLNTGTVPNGPQTVIKVQTGRFDWASQYDQLAVMVAWYGDPKPVGQEFFTKWVEVDTVNPQDLSIRRGKLFEFSNLGCGFDFAVGNFDRRQSSDNAQGPRDPDLQIAVAWGNCPGVGGPVEQDPTVAILDVKPEDNFAVVTTAKGFYALGHNLSFSDIRLSAGDTQARSLRLGEPEAKIVIDGTAQPTAIIAAPPMHVDFMAAVGQTQQTVLNLSTVPEGFYATYDSDETSSNQSSSTHTTSWSFGAKESVTAGVTVGDPEVDGFKADDTLSAAQDLKGSTENSHGTYSNNSFDISQQTGIADQVWYSQTRFNIYVYPVIGQTVCPATKPNCQDSEKVPLTVQFSGPDQIVYETLSGRQLEWYQPPWEYGNVLSYPGSFSQLQQIVPDIQKLSQDRTWATDESILTEKSTWATGTSDSQSSSFKQNYSFENDFSVSGTVGLDGIGASFGYSVDVGGSFGFSSLNKSSTDLGKSTGIGVRKPGSFLDPGNYSYFVTPYIFGRTQPGGSVDNIPLSGDIQTYGLMQTAFVVDPTRNDAGGWWKQAYTTAPDVAVNHPNRWQVTTPELTNPIPANCLATGTGSSQMDCVSLSPSYPNNPWVSEFHHMRGFFISSANTPGQGPQLETATAGDKLTLQARVHNYSLKAMNDGSKVHVRFYGQEWNNSNNTAVGSSFLIGEDVLDPIPPFSSDSGADPNWVLARADFDTTAYQNKYLIFWVLVWSQEADGTLTPEIANHGLNSIPGAAKSLADIGTESYGNNVGFYKMPFYVFAPPSGGAGAVTATPEEAGDVRLGLVRVSERRIAQGQATEVSVLLRTRTKSASGVSVTFYDGDPAQGGKAFDVEKIPHIRARDAHEVKVPFRSNTCGEHRIFVKAGGGKPYEATNASRPVTVKCAPPPPPARRI